MIVGAMVAFGAQANVGCGSKTTTTSTTMGAGGASSAMASNMSMSSSTQVVSTYATGPTGSSSSSMNSTVGTGGSGSCLMNDKITFDKGGPCDMCIDANCCTEVDACTKNGSDTQGCVDDDMKLVACSNGCTANDPNCMTQMCMDCINTCVTNAPRAGPLINCLGMNCNSECGGG